jgi:hypothetical protein
MSAIVSDEHLDAFHRLGYALVRGLLPAALIRDLRRACDHGRELVREAQGPQAQRFQPVARFGIDQRPFAEYRELPALRELLTRLLSDHHSTGDPALLLGVLVEPAQRPWTTHWHRDWPRQRLESLGGDWRETRRDLDYFNQINCALHTDVSLWVVPGSHHRDDTPEELAAVGGQPDSEAMGVEEAELAGLAYCRRMPGAVQVLLEPGDLLLYRNVLWHTGAYAPDRRRATLHDIVETPRYRALRQRHHELQQVPQAAAAPA